MKIAFYKIVFYDFYDKDKCIFKKTNEAYLKLKFMIN